jgi:phosphatidylserine/phosphatidylglycerophosphate/cardiolipin synthase-like enzyme
MPAQFLPNPARIRGAVGTLAKQSKRMDLAVAFVGRDWSDALAHCQGNLRLICWLSSTNTNPRAVRQLIKRPKTKVRQRDGMHAKVYLTDVGAVVGSANLSAEALSEIEQNGRDEAAVFLNDKVSRDTIDKWFSKLWNDPSTRQITKPDLRQAIKAYDKAHKGGKLTGGKAKKTEIPQHTFAYGRVSGAIGAAGANSERPRYCD